MASYNFNKPGVNKVIAFDAYLRDNFSEYNGMNYSDPDLTVDTNTVLSAFQYNTLLNLVNDYTDPTVFLLFDTQVTDNSSSASTNSAQLTTVQKLIFSPLNPIDASGVFNTLKLLMEYSTDEVADFASGSTGASVNLVVYDYSNNGVLSDTQIDLSSILFDWQNLAQSTSGPQSVSQFYTVDNLRSIVSPNDAIWYFKLAVNNSSNGTINVKINAHQRLFYDVY